MRLILALLLAVHVSVACGQSANTVVIGGVDSVYSTILKENRKVWIYVPNAAKNSLYGKQHYPVVYLLDGDTHFSSLVGMIQELSENGNTVCPQMIVVGILNTDRTRDLTPSHSTAEASSGGGENFAAFLEKELMPYIDAHYPTAPYKMLMGHSYGGLTAINELVHHSRVFNSYVAIDPTLRWDDQKLLKECDTVLRQAKLGGKKLVLSMANTISRDLDTLTVRTDASGKTLNPRSILAFRDLLKQTAGNNALRWNFKYYAQDDHFSVPFIAQYDALRYLFEFYQFPTYMMFDGRNVADAEMKTICDSLLTEHYANVSREMGYTILPPEELVNLLGYGFLNQKKLETAEMLFRKNTINYSRSSNVFYSMGFFYEQKGDKQKAIDSYTQSLAIKEAVDVRKRVDELKRKVGK